MIESTVAREIVNKAMESIKEHKAVRPTDVLTSEEFYKLPAEVRYAEMYWWCVVYYKECGIGDREIYCSLNEDSMNEYVKCMKAYNDDLSVAILHLVCNEYTHIDSDTFYYCYRVGSDMGYCHISEGSQCDAVEDAKDMEDSHHNGSLGVDEFIGY